MKHRLALADPCAEVHLVASPGVVTVFGKDSRLCPFRYECEGAEAENILGIVKAVAPAYWNEVTGAYAPLPIHNTGEVKK